MLDHVPQILQSVGFRCDGFFRLFRSRNFLHFR
jgi:hypothetical protein